jgi:hypothetical protein
MYTWTDLANFFISWSSPSLGVTPIWPVVTGVNSLIPSVFPSDCHFFLHVFCQS